MPLFRLGDRLVLFVHIPRTGGTSIATHLGRSSAGALVADEEIPGLRLKPQHFHAELYDLMLPPAFYDYGFCVTRNPLDRLVSAYKAHARANESFDLWTESVFDQYTTDPYLLGNHIRPQLEFLRDKMDIFRFEDGLEKAVATVTEAVGAQHRTFDLHEGRSTHRPVEISDRTLQRVAAFYKSDFDRLGYAVEEAAASRNRSAPGIVRAGKDGPKVADGLTVSMFVPWITQGKGGTETVGAMIANEMSDRGHRVHIHTFDDNQGDPTRTLRPEITVTRHPEKPTDVAENQILMSLAIQRPDLIVGLYMNRICFRYVYYGFKLNVPVLLSEHTDPNFADEIGVLEQSERLRILSAASRVQLLTETFRNDLPAELRHRATVVPNTVEDARQQSEPGKTAGTKTILCVARLVPRKNVKALIEAFAALDKERRDSWMLRIVGYGPQKGELRGLAEARGVLRSVQFEGRQENAYPFYEAAQFVVLPSYSEGFPLVLLEAMAHGLPCVGFRDCSGVEELITDGVSGLQVDRTDEIGNLSNALAVLMSDPALREAMGRQARQIYQSDYAPTVILDRWERLIRDTAAEPPPEALKIDQQTLSQASIFQNLLDGPQTYFANVNTRNKKTAKPETTA